VVNTTCGDSNGDLLPDPGGCAGEAFGSTIRPFPGREIRIAVKFDF